MGGVTFILQSPNTVMKFGLRARGQDPLRWSISVDIRNLMDSWMLLDKFQNSKTYTSLKSLITLRNKGTEHDSDTVILNTCFVGWRGSPGFLRSFGKWNVVGDKIEHK